MLEAAKARVGLADERHLQGSALVETMQVKNGRLLHGELHLKRFEEGAKVLMMPRPPLGEFLAMAAALIKANRLKAGGLRCRYFRNGALLMHPLRPSPPLAGPKKGLRLITTPIRHFGPESLQGRLKVNSMLPNLLARWESQAWAEDGLRLTPAGYVAEGVWTNILIAKSGVLLTPPLSEGILDGTTRAVAIRAWRKKGGEVREQPLTRYDLYTADKVWVCSSLRGMLKVTEVDGRQVGKG